MHIPQIAMLGESTGSAPSTFFWSTALIIVIGVLVAAVVLLRKRMDPNEDFRGEGFSLGDLRELHRQGKLSDEEFERARGKMVEAMHAAQARSDEARAEATKRGSM